MKNVDIVHLVKFFITEPVVLYGVQSDQINFLNVARKPESHPKFSQIFESFSNIIFISITNEADNEKPSAIVGVVHFIMIMEPNSVDLLKALNKRKQKEVNAGYTRYLGTVSGAVIDRWATVLRVLNDK